MRASYQWLQEYIGDTNLSVDDTVDLLTKHTFEVEGVEGQGEDAVLDIDVLPNRSSDCLSHRGIARELATLRNTALTYDPLVESVDIPATDELSIAIEDHVLCPRFTAQLLDGVTVGPSPEWLQKRLQLIGQKPINNIVDATNYVMYALGQPLHAYDADLFPASEGVWKFAVRTARTGETIHLIGEQAEGGDRIIELTGTELLVTDAQSDTPIGLAGVKGGAYAGVHESTRKVIIEAAHFDPVRTRQTARSHNIIIDASKRFENEPSPELPVYAQAMIAKLLQEIAGGTSKGWCDVYPEPKTSAPVLVRPERINELLGLSIRTEEMLDILTRVGVTITQKDDTLYCVGPWERTDLHIEEDFAEEVGRVYGYDAVTAVLPEAVSTEEYNAVHYYSDKIRTVLQKHGFSEVITSSFRKKDSLKLHNALASDKGCLRSSLCKNITEALEKNIHHKNILGISDIRIFEIGTVFNMTDNGVGEHVSLGIGILHKQSGYSGKEDAVLAEVHDALADELGITLDWHTTKGVSEVNVTELISQLPEVVDYTPVEKSSTTQYVPFSVYPAIARDVALWVPEDISPALVAETILRALAADDTIPPWDQATDELSSPLKNIAGTNTHLQRLDLFDSFSKDNKTSYAFRLVFQAQDKTLTDEEVLSYTDTVYQAIHEQGWEVR